MSRHRNCFLSLKDPQQLKVIQEWHILTHPRVTSSQESGNPEWSPSQLWVVSLSYVMMKKPTFPCILQIISSALFNLFVFKSLILIYQFSASIHCCLSNKSCTTWEPNSFVWLSIWQDLEWGTAFYIITFLV